MENKEELMKIILRIKELLKIQLVNLEKAKKLKEIGDEISEKIDKTENPLEIINYSFEMAIVIEEMHQIRNRSEAIKSEAKGLMKRAAEIWELARLEEKLKDVDWNYLLKN